MPLPPCSQVITVLTSVIPDIQNDRQAKERYIEAQNTGKSLLIVVPKELGEAYVELKRGLPAEHWRQLRLGEVRVRA